MEDKSFLVYAFDVIGVFLSVVSLGVIGLTSRLKMVIV